MRPTEVAALARSFLDDSNSGGLEAIERECLRAVTDGRWDDVNKWHRVRLRFMRFRNERASEQLRAESRG